MAYLLNYNFTDLSLEISETVKIEVYSDEYIQGNLVNDRDGYYIFDVRFFPASSMPMDKFIEIDPSTLAIHFPDMIDSEGTKIFASLSEDGKGGSLVQMKDEGIVKFKYDHLGICLSKIEKNFYIPMTQYQEVRYVFEKVTGIQE